MKKDPEGLVFEFKDVYYADRQGKNSPWRRIKIDDLKRFQQEQAENFNCFATVQSFLDSKKPEKGKGELHTAPLYFDLDYSEDPEKARLEAVKVVDFFIKELGLEPYDLRVFFSGSKGFHILVDQVALGIQPREDLHKVFKYLVGYLKHRLGDWVTESGEEVLIPLISVDLTVYTLPRMLRLPNSVHQKTKLYKIELNIDELRNMTIAQIKELAQNPRWETDLKYTGIDRQEIRPRSKAVKLYNDKVFEYEQAASTSNNRYDRESYAFIKDNPPVCVQDIQDHGWKKPGDRNNATVQLACYYQAAGYSKEEVSQILEAWVVKFTSAQTGYDKHQRVANTRNVIESVFSQGNEYKFGCAFIRSLHGEKTAGSKDYDRVPCAGNLCHCLQRTTIQDTEPVSLHLAMTGNAVYTGKRIRTRIMVAGKKHTPYIIPRKLEFSCWGYKGCKKFQCPLLQIPSHTAYRDLGVSDRELIEMCGVGDDNIKGIIKRVAGVPACGKYDTYTNETVNVDELLVIPMAEENQNVTEDSNKGKYVLRKVYAVDNTAIKENKYYEVTGFVFPHPKNQEGTIIIESLVPLQDVVDSYKLTDDIKKELVTFRPNDYTFEGIRNKLQVLLNDLTYNVTYIVERDETLLAVLLVYHSILRFHVPWDTKAIRGWLECIILGDSSTGKSHLLRELISYVGLGTNINAEATTRTGLMYKMEQSGSGGNWYIVWGAWPLADREFIWIDEAAHPTKEDYGQMTMARSEGKLEVKRAVTAETSCQVRAVLSCNPPDKGYGSNTLSDKGSGVEWLREIFNTEDIRRFDFGVFMRAEDVSKELYNKELPTFPRTVTAEILRNNILFAWSRKPDQVIFPPETIQKIREMTTVLSNIYGNTSDIPLVSPSDQRNKLARLSAALAALTQSTDPDQECIIVYPGHVEYIFSYLRELYNAPGCRLNNYNKIANHSEEITDKKYESIITTLKSLDPLKSDIGFYNFIKLFAKQNCLGLSDIEAMLAITKEETKALIGLLQRTEMIVKRSNGYYKNSRFNSFIDKCFEKGIFDEVEGD